ncbi:MAG: hypothetical protein RLZZ200_505 [Pseudomonadota bacterium]
MTTPGYQSGCLAGSQVSGIAVAPRGYAIAVNLNNGNVNRNHQSNHYSALPCRPGECQGVTPRQLRTAWRAARRGKQATWERLSFEADWMGRLIDLEERLNAGTWTPAAPTVRIEKHPKLRQIHAPEFIDRVVHWLVVGAIEPDWERVFVHSSYSNRKGKGTHAAVRQLHRYVRQVHSGQGGGFYLQLDIRSYFLSINRRRAYAMLKARMERANVPWAIRKAVHALLTHPVSRTGVRWACSKAERDAVPLHKRLENAAPGCGLPIGNLFSQFVGNAYLNQFDQFVKHVLKVERYVRYVDDIVLVHHSREQLEAWRLQIIQFLRDELALELKPEQKLRPLTDGIDFLGYIVRPTHLTVRRRVISHCRAKLAQFERCGADPARIRSTWASYEGHFRHARSYRLRQRIHARFPWLAQILNPSEDPHAT